MGLKENIERNRLELANQEKLIKNIEQQKIEAYKNKALILHKKSSELLKPFISFIESSGCIGVLKELISLEKLKNTRIDIEMGVINTKQLNEDNRTYLPWLLYMVQCFQL